MVKSDSGRSSFRSIVQLVAHTYREKMAILEKNSHTTDLDASLDFSGQNQGKRPFHQDTILRSNLRFRSLF